MYELPNKELREETLLGPNLKSRPLSSPLQNGPPRSKHLRVEMPEGGPGCFLLVVANFF